MIWLKMAMNDFDVWCEKNPLYAICNRMYNSNDNRMVDNMSEEGKQAKILRPYRSGYVTRKVAVDACKKVLHYKNSSKKERIKHGAVLTK